MKMNLRMFQFAHRFELLFSQRYPDQEGKTDGSETVMNENQKLYYHRVGETQDKDILVAEFPENPSWRM